MIIQIGVTNITKFNCRDLHVNDLANKIIQIWLKCTYYKIENIAIFPVLVVSNENFIELIATTKVRTKRYNGL